MDDWKLLLEWTGRGSDEAFRSLVERYLNLVYSVARRSVPTPAQAEEVTQTVFIILARKAAGLSRRTVLAGWLYRTTRFTAREMLRTEHRQQARREEFSRMDTAEPPPLWEQVAPVLEEALDRIQQRDRNALVLRFLEERSFREVGQTLGITEEAARKRVDRGLEKLRAFLARRGITSTAALLSIMLTTSAVHAAPAGLAGSVTAGVAASALAPSTSTLVKSTLMVMAWTQARAIALIVLVLLLCGATTTCVMVRHSAEDGSLAEEVGGSGFALGRDSKTGAPTIMIVVPDSVPARAGLSKGLVIHSIDGVPTAGMALPECVRRIAAHRRVRLELIDPLRDATNTVEYIHGNAAQNMGGIGVALGRDTNAPATIMAVVPGSAAAQAGLSKGLVIEAIDDVPAAGLNPRECLNRIQGPPGSMVRLRLINPKRNVTNTVELTRYRL
jgi:RNA polymerase sigma factor (sigma-70 family)